MECHRSEWANTSAELLASLVALLGLPLPSTSSVRGNLRLKLAGGADNKAQANSSIAEKALTTKMPLMMVLMEFCHQAEKAGLRVSLDWRPRQENQPADDITNGDLSRFSIDKKVQVC